MRPNTENATIRASAVAGLFYPDDPAELRTVVSQHVASASVVDLPRTPKALILPHAGYIYSGAVAGAGYALIAAQRSRIRRVVLIGPSHRVYLHGIALPQADRFLTPLGEIPIDKRMKALLAGHAGIVVSDAPHAMEHCIEVHLPFLQVLLDEFELLPLVGGVASADLVASVLESAWGDEETLIVASSDLSHYHSYAMAREIDATTCAAIRNYATALSGEQACGAMAINGLLHLARRRGLVVTELARLNSGDTVGDRDRVVGYGAFAIH